MCHRVWSRGMGPMDKRSLDPETERVRRIWEKGLNSYFPIFTLPSLEALSAPVQPSSTISVLGAPLISVPFPLDTALIDARLKAVL